MSYHISFDIDFKRNTYPGKLIALEGIDGSGKTTQVKLLAEYFEKQGKTVYLTKNPTEGLIGKFIRQVLSGSIVLPPVSFQYLFAADRQVQQVEDIIPALQRGEIVITDRYFWSAIAYGIADRMGMELKNTGLYLLVAQSILSLYHQFIIPDYTLYLDIALDNAMQRLQEDEKEKELYENKKILEAVKFGYEWLLREFPKEFTTIDAEKSVEEVSKEIISNLQF